MKAMILAAGLGTRLRPFTEHTPKALVPIHGKTLIEHHLYALATAGIRECVINLHHLSNKIREKLDDGHNYGIKITYSEESTLLGTAGGVAHALRYFNDQPFLAISADIYTDFPFASLLGHPTSSAHLVLVKNPPWHPHGDFFLENGHIALQATHPFTPRYTYGNIGIFHPRLFQNIASLEVYEFNSLIRESLSHQTISAELYHGRWFNVGTHEDWQKAEQCSLEITV